MVRGDGVHCSSTAAYVREFRQRRCLLCRAVSVSAFGSSPVYTARCAYARARHRQSPPRVRPARSGASRAQPFESVSNGWTRQRVGAFGCKVGACLEVFPNGGRIGDVMGYTVARRQPTFGSLGSAVFQFRAVSVSACGSSPVYTARCAYVRARHRQSPPRVRPVRSRASRVQLPDPWAGSPPFIRE